MAVYTLPPEMITFYKSKIEYITEHSIDPDKRRYANKDEAPRHYIDMDRFGDNPFEAVPVHWKDAVAKYTEDSLKAHGILPWHIEKMMFRLTDAFRERNMDKILYLSADLGHYIADAHVPLHTTKNYNGQLTNQHGIHGFWESRLPEIYGDDYDYFVGRAKYIKKPLLEAWKIVKASYSALDSVLLFEKELNGKFPSDQKYSFEQRGSSNVKVYSREYSAEYNKMLNGMVERRMREAVIQVASFWYTAWVNAGQPKLDDFGKKEVSDSLKNVIKKELEPSKSPLPQNQMHGHDD